MELYNKEEKKIITFKSNSNIIVNVHGKLDFNILAKKMIELYNQQLNRSAS